ncbi:unnamed protein product, partial [Staurois parvus]
DHLLPLEAPAVGVGEESASDVGPTLDAAGSAPRPPGPSPLLKLGDRLFNMERLWEQRRLSNASSNIERLLVLQHETLLGLVTAVREQTTALQDLSHDIRALCQAGPEQNAPSARGSQPLCSSSLGPMPRLPQSSPVESAREAAGEQALEVPILELPTLEQPPQETPPEDQYAPSPWIPLLHLPHTPL